MRILVTGGTGFVGQHVVRRLQETGHSVRILARSHRKRRSPPGTEVTTGNILDAASLGSAVGGMDAIVHLVGIIAETGPQTFQNVHVQGVKNVLQAGQAGRVQRFIQISALGTRPAAHSAYHRTKWQAEELVRESGLAWTIFRPSIIFGHGDQFVTRFARIIGRFHVLPVIGAGTNRVQPVPVAYVADAIKAALEGERAVAQTFDLAGATRLTLAETLEAIRAVLSTRAMTVHLPLGLAFPAARILEKLFSLFGLGPPLTTDQLTMLQEDNVGDPGPATAALTLPPAPEFKPELEKLLRGGTKLQSRKL